MMNNERPITITISKSVGKFKFKFKHNHLTVSPLLWTELAKPQKKLYAENLVQKVVKRIIDI